jgi:HSP20 family protein
MSKDLIRLMHALFLPVADVCQPAPWRPAMDVCRTRRGWLVKFELAGVDARDVDLEVRGRWLTVRGVRRDDPREEGCHYYCLEIAYSAFERSLELPCDLERAAVTTDYRDGMLLVHVETEVCRDQ